MKTRCVYFASACFIRRVGREARNAVGNTKATLQKEPLVTAVTPGAVAALQAPPRAGCAFATCMICKVSLRTFLDTLGFREEKGLLTAGALTGSLALQTVAVTAPAEARVPEEGGRALLHAGPALQNVAIHALQAVCPQRPAARTATPVTFFACLGGKVKIVLWGTALLLTLPKEQDLVWISAGGTAGL